MPQEEKDTLTYSIPMLIDVILKGDTLFYAVQSLNYVKDQFYEEYVSDILKLIKEHTKKVNFIVVLKIMLYYSICSF